MNSITVRTCLKKLPAIPVLVFVLVFPGCASANTPLTTAFDAAAGDYYEGDGGKGLRIALDLPTTTRIDEKDVWLASHVQGLLTSHFIRFSAITVIDRQNLERVKKELALGDTGYYSEEDRNELGRLTNAEYLLTGNITKNDDGGYALSLTIIRIESNDVKAAYILPSCTKAQLRNTAVQTAAAELLAQLGVTLTPKGRDALFTAQFNAIAAESALAKGSAAAKSGDTAQAALYFEDARYFDPGSSEATERVRVLSEQIARMQSDHTAVLQSIDTNSGDLGNDIRSEIARERARREAESRQQEAETRRASARRQLEADRRAAWLAFDADRRETWQGTIDAAIAYYREHPPYYIVYDPSLEERNVNFERRTADIAFTMGIFPAASFKMILDILSQIEEIEKTREKEIAEAMGNSSSGVQPWKFNGDLSSFIRSYSVDVALLNGEGSIIGREKNALGSSDRIESVQREFVFTGVKADDMTGDLRIKIMSIDGIDPETITDYEYMNVWPPPQFDTYIRSLPPTRPAQPFISYLSWVTVKNWAEQHGYKFGGTQALENGKPVLGANLAMDAPVTGISVMEAILWLNAFNRYLGIKHYWGVQTAAADKIENVVTMSMLFTIVLFPVAVIWWRAPYPELKDYTVNRAELRNIREAGVKKGGYSFIDYPGLQTLGNILNTPIGIEWTPSRNKP
ncbi:hypothetical protein AGMMS49940_08720 [Spirochaetia bacterium]|nr:hypothetical protein AGMMS49940_08720 [Spirochaetia bacterium]